MEKSSIKEAYDISLKGLRECYLDQGIVAGLHRFDDYWARDSLFASFGSIKVKDFEAVRNNLNLFLSNLNELGQIPRRIDRYHVGLKYLGLKIKRKPLGIRYSTSIFLSKAIDQNSIFLITFLQYIKETKDLEYLKRNYSKLKQIIDWNFLHYQNNLIKEGFFATWEDTTLKRGHTLYTNVLHFGALNAFILLSALINENASDYKEKVVLLREIINKEFWKEKFYSSWTTKKDFYFCTIGNLLAIILGVADKDKAESILDYIKENFKDKTPLPSSYPNYTFWRRAPLNFLRGKVMYHNGFSWLWIGCWYVVALSRLDRKKEALKTFNQIAEVINAEKEVYEVYFDKKPVKKMFFKADYPFAWSCGMYVYVYNLLKRKD
ncbi:MAG: amylo-alpha-1,6-glucosidase [Candidatus Nanoarchaeia archaeon]|nr:amylo-alpha-1,6-glucosidase [Candidatus Nanoarchaeia archaeon]MDD5587860.1 amylo-alpha-1,6-glucosidase [Candidatus Nanoarchaeia archaeon]